MPNQVSSLGVKSIIVNAGLTVRLGEEPDLERNGPAAVHNGKQNALIGSFASVQARQAKLHTRFPEDFDHFLKIVALRASQEFVQMRPSAELERKV